MFNDSDDLTREQLVNPDGTPTTLLVHYFTTVYIDLQEEKALEIGPALNLDMGAEKVKKHLQQTFEVYRKYAIYLLLPETTDEERETKSSAGQILNMLMQILNIDAERIDTAISDLIIRATADALAWSSDGGLEAYFAEVDAGKFN